MKLMTSKYGNKSLELVDIFNFDWLDKYVAYNFSQFGSYMKFMGETPPKFFVH